MHWDVNLHKWNGLVEGWVEPNFLRPTWTSATVGWPFSCSHKLVTVARKKFFCGLFAGELHGLAPAQPYMLPLSFSYNDSSRWHKSAKLIRLIERTPDWDEALVQPKSRAAGSVKEKLKDYFRLSLEVKSRVTFRSGINQLSYQLI